MFNSISGYLRSSKSALFLMLVLLASNGYATTVAISNNASLEMSGFLSIGAATLDGHHVMLGSVDDDIDHDFDSVLAGQFILTIGEKLSFTTQLIARGYTEEKFDEYDPRIEWAYASYDFSPSIKVRAGRLRTPYYRYSDYLDVGYAYPWARPPIDIYALVLAPFSNYDGIELLYSGKKAGFEITSQLAIGGSKKNTRSSKVKSSPVAGFNLSAGNEHLNIRYAYFINTLDFTVEGQDTLIALLNSISGQHPNFGTVADLLEIKEEPFHFQSLSITYEYQSWVAQWEIMHNDATHKFLPDIKGTYASLSYQFDYVTPYVVIGASKNAPSATINNLLLETFDTIPEDSNQPVDGIRDAALDIDVAVNQRSQTLGMRIDIFENMDIKVEWQRIKPLHGNWGQLDESSGEEPHDVNLYSIVFDMIF